MKKDHPGIYIPPPLFYIGIYFVAVLFQKWMPINKGFFDTVISRSIALAVVLTGLFFIFPAIWRFFKSGNTLVTVKSANSLQTSGIYAFTRNPMYLGLLLIYLGFSLCFGSWWNFLLLPVLLLIIQQYVIKREEQYLGRRFGERYFAYKKKVRRWI